MMIEIIKKVVYVLAFLSIGFSLTEVYLTSNKLWKRKHDNEVAESVSVMAGFMAIIPGFFFALNYFKGGFAYQTNYYYSKQYAQIICDQYRSFNLISFVTTIDQILVSS